MIFLCISGVKLEVLMPKCILNCVLTANQGKYNFDPVSKILHWDIGKIDVSKLPNIRGSVSFKIFSENLIYEKMFY